MGAGAYAVALKYHFFAPHTTMAPMMIIPPMTPPKIAPRFTLWSLCGGGMNVGAVDEVVVVLDPGVKD